MTWHLQWRVPSSALTLRWGGPDNIILPATAVSSATLVPTLIGPPGARGPAGPAGATGPAGPPGPVPEIIDGGTFT